MSFARPEWLPWLWALAVIPLFYLIRRRARRVRVPHLFLWERILIDPKKQRLRRIRDVVSILLQCCIGAALILAAAAPHVMSSSGAIRSVAIILDGSLSMSATDTAGVSRWTRALRRAEEDAVIMAAQGPLSVAVVAGDVSIPLPFGSDPGRLRALLPTLTAPGGELDTGLLESYVRGIESRGDAPLIRLYSDGADPSLAGVLARNETLQLVPITSDRPNAGIVSLDVGAAESKRLAARAVLEAFGGDVEGRLIVRGAQDDKTAAPFFLREIALVAGQRETVDIGCDALPDLDVVELVWESRGGDALAADDAILIPLEKRRRARVLVVADRVPEPLKKALLALADVVDLKEAQRARPAGWRSVPRADLTILVGVQESEPLPPGAYLLIQSFAPGLGISLGVRKARPRGFTSRLKGLDPRDLDIATASVLRADPSVDVLLEGVAGPLICRGERNGVRFEWVAFDLSEETTSFVLMPAWPLFLLDAVERLTPHAVRLTPSVAAAGRLFVAGDEGEGHELLFRDLVSGKETLRSFRRPGRIVRAPVTPSLYRVEGRQTSDRMGVGVLSADSSDLSAKTPLPDVVPPVPEPPRSPSPLDLTPWFLAIAIFLLLLEWGTFVHGWTR